MRSKAILVLAVVLLSMGVVKAETWTTIPIGEPRGISGNIIVDRYGWYDIYDTAQTKIPLEFPGATDTHVTGIDGNNIVGYYWNDPSQPQLNFIYNGIQAPIFLGYEFSYLICPFDYEFYRDRLYSSGAQTPRYLFP